MIGDTPYTGARAVVIGAAGFIGRWVAAALCERGAEVHAVVRDQARAARIFAAWGVTACVYELDLAADMAQNAAGLRGLYRGVRPQVTFNLAGYGVDPAERDAGMAYALNARLPAGLVTAAAETRDPAWPGRSLVHAGSALEYGMITGDLAEDSAPRPTTLYGCSKLAGTHFLAAASQERRVLALTARLFTVYGPGEHPGRLLPALLRCARTGADLPLTAGTQRRDFTYVADAAEGLLRLGLTGGPPGEVVNLATGRLTTVRDFAEQAAARLSVPPARLLFGRLPLRSEEMAADGGHSPVNIDRLRRLAGWTPGTLIDEGVHKTMVFMDREGVNE